MHAVEGKRKAMQTTAHCFAVTYNPLGLLNTCKGVKCTKPGLQVISRGLGVFLDLKDH